MEVLPDVLRKAQLVLQAQALLLVPRRRLKVHARLGHDVRQLVLALVGLDVSVHAAKLLLDDGQTLVDEVRRVHRYLVLVVDRVLVVHRDQRVQKVLSAGNRLVLVLQVDDRGRLARKGDRQRGHAAVHNRLARQLLDLDAAPVAVLRVVERGLHHDAADLRRHRVAHGGHRVETGGQLLAAHRHAELAQAGLATGLGGDGEADVLVRLRVGERHPDRRLRVKLQRAQALAADVAHVQRQAADNLLHQAASLEDEHLVVHVAGAAKKAQVAEHRRLPYAPAALVLVADEHRRLAAVRPGRGGQVEGRKNQARKHRAREPLPVGADEHQHVRKVDLFVLLQGGALGLLFFVCHAFSFISSKLVTFFLAAQRPGEGKPPAGASVPGGTVNYCTSHGELLYFAIRRETRAGPQPPRVSGRSSR